MFSIINDSTSNYGKINPFYHVYGNSNSWKLRNNNNNYYTSCIINRLYQSIVPEESEN